MNGKELLTVRNISKSYISEGKVNPVLRKINLTFENGEFVAITGSSGCGKTTLLNIIGGIITADDGDILFKNRKISEYSIAQQENYVKNKIAYITQDNRLIYHYSALKNIMCAVMIQGYSKSDAQVKAKELLDTVGLAEFADRKACKLSAGQRQRLAIAQILAKDSEVILADEPTANLDSENGTQIMELLKKISADHLIVMVTHNVAQAQKYVTRQVTIHSGIVESDVQISEKAAVADAKQDNNKENDVVKTPKGNYVRYFVKWNIFSGIGRSITISSFATVIAVVVFIFFGLIFANADSIYTKLYSNEAFSNKTDNRIVVCRQDGQDITDEDIDKLSSIKYVEDSEKYDCINDVNYYMTQDVDYRYIYEVGARRTQWIKKDNFMRSCAGITESDLTAGVLPLDRYDILVSTNDQALIGTQLIVYLHLPKLTTEDQMFAKVFTIVGTVGGNTKQAYFSEPFCQMITSLYAGYDSKILYTWSNENKKFVDRTDIIPMIDDSLEGQNASITDSFTYSTFRKPNGSCQIETTSYESIYKLSQPIIQNVDIKCDYYAYSDLEYEEGDFDNYYNDSTFPYLNVSEETFNKLFAASNKQMGLFIKDYVYTDKVLDKINSIGGYSASSTFRMSMIESDSIKAHDRLKVLGMSFAFLFITALIGVILINRFMGLRKNDYNVMVTLGMDKHQMVRMVCGEQTIFGVVALIVTSAGVAYAWIVLNDKVFDFMKYFFTLQYVICILFFVVVIAISELAFGKTMCNLVRHHSSKNN